MFDKILIANRGEIAVRIIRTCRDMGIRTVAVYTPNDIHSLHVRLADEAVLLHSARRYGDSEEIIAIAQQVGANAVHPGYGFLAEKAEFAQACVTAGITFIGPSPRLLEILQAKVTMLDQARAAGVRTPEYSSASYEGEHEALKLEAAGMGYPVVIKSCRGGRGRGARMALGPEQIDEAIRRAETEAKRVYGSARLYVEKALLPIYYVDVQVLGDEAGNIIHLGERCSSLQQHNQKLVAETPAPCLPPDQRQAVCQIALQIARTFGLTNAGTVEFLVDSAGQIYFNDFKGRIQVEHPITEMVTRLDIVAEQIRIAAGQGLRHTQDAVEFRGWAMQCRINAEDPWNHFLPSPGLLTRFRLPGGPGVRVDTYGYAGCKVPERYDSLLAKLIVWSETRDVCLARMQRALQDFAIEGVQTNLPLLQRLVDHPDFVAGDYDIEFIQHTPLAASSSDSDLRDIAIAAAVAFDRRNQAHATTQPPRIVSGWHRSARQLPG